MPVAFSLTAADYKLLERAITNRFHDKHGRLNVAYFLQVFAWMFATLAVTTFFKQWRQSPETAHAYGVILLFAVLGFLLASARPMAGQWLYRRYVAASMDPFTAEQSVEIINGSLVLESSNGRSIVQRSAIIDCSEDERNHYLFLTGVQAITIPKATGAALGTEFKAFLSARHSEA